MKKCDYVNFQQMALK